MTQSVKKSSKKKPVGRSGLPSGPKKSSASLTPPLYLFLGLILNEPSVMTSLGHPCDKGKQPLVDHFSQSHRSPLVVPSHLLDDLPLVQYSEAQVDYLENVDSSLPFSKREAVGSLDEDPKGKRVVSLDRTPICRSLNFDKEPCKDFDPLEEHITLADLKACRSRMVIKQKQSRQKLVLLDEDGDSEGDERLASTSSVYPKWAWRWAPNHPAVPIERPLLELLRDWQGGGNS